jgi:alanine racemase
MNLVMIDLGPKPDAEEGDPVILMGSDGNEAIWADEIARWCGTISYEVLTSIRTTDRRIKSS